MADTQPNIYETLRAVQVELKAPKDQKGRFGAHRNAEGILKAVKPLNEKHGITLIIGGRVEEVAGRTYQVAVARVTLDGSEWVSAEGWAWEGEISRGLDAPQVSGAASSYARKYALGGLYDIDDSAADPDRHMDAPNAHSAAPTAPVKARAPSADAPATDIQKRQITSFLRALNVEDGEMVQFVKDEFGYDLKSITKADAVKLLKELQ